MFSRGLMSKISLMKFVDSHVFNSDYSLDLLFPYFRRLISDIIEKDVIIFEKSLNWLWMAPF